MRVFLDSNVWVSGFATRGLCADLIRLLLRHHRGQTALLLSEKVRDECLRILRDKFGASEIDLDTGRAAMAWAEFATSTPWQPPSGFPDPDDAPILAAALAANAGLFVSGDRALLDLEQLEGLPIVTPRTAYERLRCAR